MKNVRKLTTVQISIEASKMLGRISVSHMRKKGPHVEWLIRKEYQDLLSLKLIKAIDDDQDENNGN